MEIHHGKHHAAYVANLNKALAGERRPGEPSASRTCWPTSTAVPEDIRTAVRNNGGGHANHTLFWEIMSPEGRRRSPTGDLAEAIDDSLRQLRRLQGEVQGRRRGPLRQRLGLAGR